MPISQRAYQEFNRYYQRLSTTEREALNKFWIDAWDSVTVYYLDGIIDGYGPVKFRDLYESINSQCVHAARRVINSIKAHTNTHLLDPVCESYRPTRLRTLSEI